MSGPAAESATSRCQRLLDAGVAEIGEPAPLAGDHLRAQIVVERESAEQFGCIFHIFGRELHAGAAERFRHRGGGIGEHRHVGRPSPRAAARRTLRAR